MQRGLRRRRWEIDNPSVLPSASHLPLHKGGFYPVGKSYVINIDVEKLTFSIGEKPNEGRDRFTFQNHYDMIKEKGGDSMSKEYVFEFPGTKEDFLNCLNRFSHNASYSSGTFYYFDDYIVKLVGDEIHFGVARGGHSGGYWFVPTITDLGEKMEFRGEIQYIGPSSENRGAFKKAIDGIGEFLLLILILPIALAIRIYMFMEWLIRKIFNHPKPKEKTNEERLFDLMENYFGCVGK